MKWSSVGLPCVTLAFLSTAGRISVCLLAVLLVNLSARAADWPTFLHDYGRGGGGEEQLQTPLTLSWSYTSPIPPETAWQGPRAEPFEGLEMRHRVDFDNVLHVTVADGRTFFGSSVDNKVVCVATDSGEILWQFFTDGPVRLAPTFADNRIFFGADDGYVYSLAADSGTLLWKLRAGPSDERCLARGRMISRWPIRTGVVVEDDIAYFGAGVLPHEGVFLYAVRAENGEQIWCNDTISEQDAGRNPLSPQGYLLLHENRLIVPSGRSLPTAFDKLTGKQIHQRSLSWRTSAGGEVGGAKAILADDQIYASGSQHFVAMDEKSGSVGFAWIDGHQLAIHGDLAYVADGKQILAVNRLQHAAATIERQKLRLKVRDLRAERSKLSATEYNNQLAELNRSIAELSSVGVLWTTSSAHDDALIASGAHVYAGGDGAVVALSADSGEILWEADVEGTVGGLAAANGHLFASTTAGKIYSYASNDRPDIPKTPGVLPTEPEKNPYPDDRYTAMYVEAAEEILRETGVTRGYCLVVGSGRGRLAYEIARRSELRIYGIEADAALAHESRRLLDSAALHGTRITILAGDPNDMPFSDYFANLIVSDQLLHTGELPSGASEVVRCLKPCGGKICLALPSTAPANQANSTIPDMTTIIDEINLELGAPVQKTAVAWTVERGPLSGVGDWSHQYGDAANTMASDDQRVRGDLGVLWYGDPGPQEMVNRHDAAAAPLSTGGRMFVQGHEAIEAYDAYNGLFLWKFQNPGAVRTGVFNNEDTSNFAASEKFVFSVVDDQCTILDAATGIPVREVTVPKSDDGQARIWGYVAHDEGTLYGTSTLRQELDRARRRRGLQTDKATDALFAIDVASGKQKWSYRGGSLEHVTIAIGDGHVFFIDSSISREEREALLHEDKTELQNLSPAEAAEKEAELKKLDVRLAVCLDAETGRQLWARAVDVTDCSRVGIGGGNLMLMYHDGHVVICGANANGHYWRQFLSGQFSRRRLVVLDSRTGDKLWSKDANYRHRPIIVDDEIFAEPWAFNIHTGEPKMREHPVTGEQTIWQFSRPGHHCGPVTAAPNMLFFRSGFTGYYDLYDDSGTTHFAGQRLGCWVNAIPGNGLLMVPEASAGCVCQFSLAATIVMQPREERTSWRIYSAASASTPVKHLALNFGAPGDRRSSEGVLWLSFPRPKTVGRLEYTLPIKPTYAQGGQVYFENERKFEVENAETPWVYTSGIRDLRRCEFPVLGEDDAAGRFTVRCHFSLLQPAADVAPFNILLQGQVVASDVNVELQAGGIRRALVLDFDDVEITDNLILELDSQSDALPAISGLEIRRQD